ncbi:hypothetical protein Landi51_03758 [Colletotrichum acutatum]
MCKLTRTGFISQPTQGNWESGTGETMALPPAKVTAVYLNEAEVSTVISPKETRWETTTADLNILPPILLSLLRATAVSSGQPQYGVVDCVGSGLVPRVIISVIIVAIVTSLAAVTARD